MNSSKPIQQKVVVGAVVAKDNQVLILQRSDDETTMPGLWELPSGKKEPLQPTEQELIREVLEETGLQVTIRGLISVFDYQVEKPDVIRDSTQINFLVEPVADRDVAINLSEHQAYAWVDAQNLDQYEVSQATKQVILSAFEALN